MEKGGLYKGCDIIEFTDTIETLQNTYHWLTEDRRFYGGWLSPFSSTQVCQLDIFNSPFPGKFICTGEKESETCSRGKGLG